MAMMISPLQPFVVRGRSHLSLTHLTSLTLLYQPLMGIDGVSLFLTLIAFQSIGTDSQSLRHKLLLQHLNIGINELNQARHKVEALGLIDSYRDKESHPEPRHQLIIYKLHLPLTEQEFLQNAQLSTALYKQLGEQDYSELITRYQIKQVNPERFIQETAEFKEVFYAKNQAEQPQAKLENKTETKRIYPNTFNYSQFMSFVMSEGIDHQHLTYKLKDQIFALHEIYAYNESELAELVFLATDKATGKLDFTDLKAVAHRRYKPTKNTVKTQDSTDAKPVESQTTTFPYQYSEQELKQRRNKLAQEYPNLSHEDVILVTICETTSLESFLVSIQEARNGFATDNELYYVNDLTRRFNIKPEMVNFLVYYLLIIINKESLYKGDLQRTANEWQQLGLDSTVKAVDYVRQQEKIKQVQGKTKNRPYTKRRKGSQHKEIIPSWMREEDTPANNHNSNTSKPLDEQALRARFDQLTKEEGD